MPFPTPRRRALPILAALCCALALAACDTASPALPGDAARPLGRVAAQNVAAPGAEGASVTCPCFDLPALKDALEFDSGWVTFWDATFGSYEQGSRHVLLDNDVPSAVWTAGVERVDGVHSCRYALYTPQIFRSADNLSAAQAEVCRLTLYEVAACGDDSVYGPSNSCDEPFIDPATQRQHPRSVAERLPRQALEKLAERARLAFTR